MPADSLIHSAQFAASHDPHIWNSPALWRMAAGAIADGLREIDPVHTADYDARRARFAATPQAATTTPRSDTAEN